MAEQELLTWVKSRKGWLKEYKGKMYSRSAKQLGCPPTKAASRTAANEWWLSKQAEIDRTLNARKHPAHVIRPYEEAMENHRLFARWHRKYGDIEEAQKSESFIEWLREALKGENPPELKGWHFNPIHEETDFLDNWERRRIWKDRLEQIQREEKEEKNLPKENSIRAHIDHHLKILKTLGKNKIGTLDTYRCRLNAFRRWVEPSATLEHITEALWERYCIHLARQVKKGEITQTTRAAEQVVARNFINSLVEDNLIPMAPRNLRSRKLAVSAPLQKIETFTKEEIQAMLGAADERTTLYLLLGLNCGFYAVDIGTLRKEEVDLEAGRIKRKRTKTRDRSDDVPEVDYLLWRRTLDLLKTHWNTGPHHPELALVNEEGNPLWWEKEREDGKVCRNNTVKSCYFRLQKEDLKLPPDKRKSWKILRKTAASKLEEHEVFGRYAEYFLGEVPRSVASRHYVQPSTKQFDAAVKWLGKQFSLS